MVFAVEPMRRELEAIVVSPVPPEVPGSPWERVREPSFPVVPKRFVEDAVVEKRLVVVAEEVVEFPVIVKFPTTVDEAPAMKAPPRVESPVTEREPRVPNVVRLEEPAQVERAVFSTLFRARVVFRFAVEVPEREPVPLA